MEITQNTVDRLHLELEEIEVTALPLARMSVVRAQRDGDIAENPDVRLALAELAQLDARVSQIRTTLSDATIVTVVNADVVATGLLVELSFGPGDCETYLFGTVEDRHPEHDVLSANSPIGQAIAGHAPGESVDVPMGAGTVTIAIVAIRTP
jgi:transcription elongation factor GreA